jgi:hypothetical protein
MTTQITINDLVQALRKAASNPEAHEPAQRSFFSKLKEDSVLVSHDKACCVAGYLMLKAHEGACESEIADIVELDYYSCSDGHPSEWVSNELGLTYVEQTLAFDSCTHHAVHRLLADLLEAGLRLPNVGTVGLSSNSDYTNLSWVFVSNPDRFLSLDELLDWMRANAK